MNGFTKTDIYKQILKQKQAFCTKTEQCEWVIAHVECSRSMVHKLFKTVYIAVPHNILKYTFTEKNMQTSTVS